MEVVSFLSKLMWNLISGQPRIGHMPLKPIFQLHMEAKGIFFLSSATSQLDWEGSEARLLLYKENRQKR